MNNIKRDARSKFSTYGNGKAIIEILNIGFEPLLTDEEYDLYKEIGKIKYKINSHKRALKLIESKLLSEDDSVYYRNWLKNWIPILEKDIANLKNNEKEKDKCFRNMLTNNTRITRTLNPDREFKSEDQFRDIKIFESDLTRSFGCRDMDHSEDIISVVTYYTEIFDSILHNGFIFNEKKYVFFTAGAGQTRCKKSTFVSEDKLNENFNKLFCGLTREEINRQGGMNTNKYLAYTSLCQTNSEIWTDFDIDRAIVVEDIEYQIPDQQVRYIYTETPEDKENIKKLQYELDDVLKELKKIRDIKKSYPKGYRRTKEEISHEKQRINHKKFLIKEINEIKSKYHKSKIKTMPITIPFTDGFGISLKKMQSSMIRLPFIKGLIAYCPRRAFMNWCSENNISIHQVVDIYGKKHSITDIDYIFTKSQFKMWKYYNNVVDENENVTKTGWEVYKENFIQYKCDACRCNVEKNVKLNAKTNYQILITLTTEMTNEDLLNISAYDINNLNSIGRNVNSMLNVLGADEKKNDNLSWLQKSLILYPEMLKDFYIKTLLKNTKDSMIKKMRSGKFNINGAYTFAIPDTLACLQWWFTDMDKTKLDSFGFVKEGNVACNLFSDGEEVDCLRSPHLDHAHCIRNNYIDEDSKKWIKSSGVYISMMDIMSKLLMYDNDGDKLLLHNNKTIIKCAKSFQKKYGMIPNYYEMSKANPQQLTSDSLFEGIVMAYHHGNIGTPSNEITKVFMTLNPESTREEIMEAIDVVALRCADVNFTIDYAKTLYKPTIPEDVISRYKKYSGKKVPHFFVYAKNKTEEQVEEIGECNIDRISNVVKSNRIVFKDLLGTYSYKMLMSNPEKSIDIKNDRAKAILDLYIELNEANIRKMSHLDVDSMEIDEKKKTQLHLEYDTNKQRELFLEITNEPIEYITDVLVKGLQDDINKDTLWRLFGEIIYSNLENNLDSTSICKSCGKRFKFEGIVKKKPCYCDICAKKIHRIQKTKSEKNRRKIINNA